MNIWRMTERQLRASAYRQSPGARGDHLPYISASRDQRILRGTNLPMPWAYIGTGFVH